MIVDSGKYFLYRHIRPDKNEPFYIGIGTKEKGAPYRRAENSTKRNIVWKRIVSKNQGKYEVEILFESNDYTFLKEKEKEFIKMYGRKDLNTGSLANLTDGGEGNLGWRPSEETLIKFSLLRKGKSLSEEHKRKLSESLKGRIVSEETRKKSSLSRKGVPHKIKGGLNYNARKVIDTTTGIVYECVKDAEKYLNVYAGYLRKRLKKQIRNNTSMCYYSEYLIEAGTEQVSVQENKGNPTIELIYDDQTLWTNNQIKL